MTPTEMLDPTLETPEAPVQPGGDPPAPDQPDEVPGEETGGEPDQGGESDAPAGV